jgi:hypothetical protein
VCLCVEFRRGCVAEWTVLENVSKLTRARNNAVVVVVTIVPFFDRTGCLDEAFACLRLGAFIVRHRLMTFMNLHQLQHNDHRPNMRSMCMLLAARNCLLVQLTTVLDVQDNVVPPCNYESVYVDHVNPHMWVQVTG